MPINTDQAVHILTAAEVRIMKITRKPVIGIWSDRDDRAIRYCLKVLGMDGLPVKHLEDPDVPLRYKVRKGSGG